MSAISSNLGSQAQLAAQIQIATLAQANDAVKAQGQAAISLLESAVELSKGQTPPVGPGRIDVYA